MRLLNKILILISISLVGFWAWAQEEGGAPASGGGGSEFVESAPPSDGGGESSTAEASPKGAPRKSIRVQFDDELVKGAASNPEMEFINARKDFNFNKMLNLRKNYIPEVRKKRGSFDP